MKTFRRLVSVLLLAFVLAIPAMAGETQTPPDSGETQGPNSTSYYTAPGNTQGPGFADTGDIGGTGILQFLLAFLNIF